MNKAVWSKKIDAPSAKLGVTKDGFIVTLAGAGRGLIEHDAVTLPFGHFHRPVDAFMGGGDARAGKPHRPVGLRFVRVSVTLVGEDRTRWGLLLPAGRKSGYVP